MFQLLRRNDEDDLGKVIKDKVFKLGKEEQSGGRWYERCQGRELRW